MKAWCYNRWVGKVVSLGTVKFEFCGGDGYERPLGSINL